ncbi:MAG TPA: MarR family transcriptional regulator [Geminicoccaceae bacterium]|nr:MarR family transcriptional regulator [Geminicoccaceae bacterium]
MYDPYQAVGVLLVDVARLLRRNFNRRAQALGLTQPQWQALARLSQNQGMSQACLADLLEIQPITLTRLIDRLEAAGWVERRPDPADRRVQRLFLTVKVEPLLDDMWALAAETREEAMQGLSDRERRQLLQTLQTIKGNLVRAEVARA